jgi:low affinity Fe/Cu permease
VKMAKHPIRHVLTQLGVWTAYPAAFLVVPIYGALWLALDRDSFNWHSVAVLATWFMTLVIQRAEHRDTQALHAKLDELLHVQDTASNALTNIDKKDPEDIERHRKIARAND